MKLPRAVLSLLSASCWRWSDFLGGLPGWSPADLAVPESARGLAFFVARLPCL